MLFKSGKYDLENTSVVITQTGGGCRATNYIGFLRKAIYDAGFKDIPVVSLSINGIEKNGIMKNVTLQLINRAIYECNLWRFINESIIQSKTLWKS